MTRPPATASSSAATDLADSCTNTNAQPHELGSETLYTLNRPPAPSRHQSPIPSDLTERNRAAQELFAPLAATYDRYARLLSLGQDPRWRSFLVSRVEARPEDTILDVATGTAAVALELARRYGCRVVGVDQSAEMLAAGRARVRAAGLNDRVELGEARAEALPYEDDTFAGLTFAGLLRYVDDPGATLRELARVVRPGGPVAMLDFFVPPSPPVRAAWELYVRAGLPLLGRLAHNGWRDVGDFLGPSIRSFWARCPPQRLLGLWREAGIQGVRARTLSMGGGVVVWGRRGD
jgi:demethylmenaquinone methyltransferase / 2-methoxy-6-polyprenyl-1,4-benzoquinol methylase